MIRLQDLVGVALYSSKCFVYFDDILCKKGREVVAFCGAVEIRMEAQSETILEFL